MDAGDQRPNWLISWVRLDLRFRSGKEATSPAIEHRRDGRSRKRVGRPRPSFGHALWTGVVVVVFLQIFPEAKRRHFKLALDAYEAALREEAGA